MVYSLRLLLLSDAPRYNPRYACIGLRFFSHGVDDAYLQRFCHLRHIFSGTCICMILAPKVVLSDHIAYFLHYSFRLIAASINRP